MMYLSKHIRKSLSTRLSLWIVLFAALIFIIAMGFMFNESREAIRKEAINHATQILDNTAERVNTILTKVEVATNNTDWLAARHLDAPDSMFVYTNRILKNNPELNGCSISFEPYFFKDRGRFFSAYSQNNKGIIITTQKGNETYEYFVMDWYQLPKLLDRPCWTEPFIDYNPESISSVDRIISYCKPLKDSQGKFVGTISVDLSLDSLSNTISAVKPYPNSYSIMIGQSGTFFVHPDTTKLFYQSIFTETLEKPDTAMTNLGHAMQAGEEGMRQMVVNGKDCYVFYKPLGKTGWSVAIVCTESDIFGNYFRLLNSVIVIILIGLGIMLFVFSRVISRELNPLQQLANEAEAIASGQFDETLPPTNRIDEIGMLSQSFSNMQQSLNKYIEELKETTASKALIEGELQIASNIQMSMLPKIFPPYPDRNDIDIYGQLTPAKEVGGDLYDFYIRDEKLFFCIGDVSGKGVPASLVMAMTRAMFRTVSAHENQPAKIVKTINDAMSESNDSNMFVTFFVGVLDLPTGRLRYCNGGHNAPFAITQENVHFLDINPNLPLGILPDFRFSEQEAQIPHGASIFLYTDGLNEAENINHEQLGDDKILEVAQQMYTLSSKEQIALMADVVTKHANGAEQSDDLTMLSIKYLHQQDEDAKTRRLTLKNDVDELTKLPEFVDTVCEEAGVDMALIASLNLALEEAVTNVVLYAYVGGEGTVDIDAVYTNKNLRFIITDSGIAFDPTKKEEADTTLSAEERPIGGLGIHLVRQIMDSVNYERINGKNILTLIKKL
jgi:Serine phosphatase RsbU, regulator of sigma subunit